MGCQASAAAARGEERGPTPVSPEQIRQAIGKLGDLDYTTRMTAGRTIRRAPAAQAVPALMQAVSEHADGFIRFRALIILTGFNDPRMPDMMEELMASPNDRLREVAYAYFEQHPEPPLAAKMLAALDKEQGEFVRPALVRALAAVASAPGVTEALVRDTGRGLDFFRSTVIEAVGDYKIAAAVPKLMEIAKIDGPLQDDAATALGKIGDKAGARHAGGAAAHRIERDAAGNHGRHLPDRQQLLGAHQLPGKGAWLRRNVSGLPGIAARRGGGSWRDCAAGQRRGARTRCSTSASRRRIRCARRSRSRSAWWRSATCR